MWCRQFQHQKLIDTVCRLHRGHATASPARQEASRATTGPAAGRDAIAKPTVTTSQPAQPSRPAAQTATQPAAKLDEKLFTLGNSDKLSWCQCAAFTADVALVAYMCPWRNPACVQNKAVRQNN